MPEVETSDYMKASTNDDFVVEITKISQFLFA